MDFIVNSLRQVALEIDEQTKHSDNHKIIILTIVLTLIVTKIYNTLFDRISPIPLIDRIKSSIFTNVRKLPYIGTEIAKQVEKAEADVHNLPTFQLAKDENNVVSSYTK